MKRAYKAIRFLAGVLLLGFTVTLIQMAFNDVFHEHPIFAVVTIFAIGIGSFECLWGYD